MKVQKFESVKVTVEAVQFADENQGDIADWTKGNARAVTSPFEMVINTKEGMMTVSAGDWVVKEPFPTGDRDFYPVKADIFAKRYRLAGQQNSVMLWYGIAIVVTALIMGFGFGILYAIEFAKH